MKEIECLQENLLLIRRAVGWSAEEFGNRIGVTRQTINNLETKRNNCRMTKTQYIAIRAVLDAEIAEYPNETKMLVCLLDCFVDNPDNYTQKDKEALLAKANMLTPSILVGTTSREEVSNEWIEFAKDLSIPLIISLLPIVLPSMIEPAHWIIKALHNKSK